MRDRAEFLARYEPMVMHEGDRGCPWRESTGPTPEAAAKTLMNKCPEAKEGPILVYAFQGEFHMKMTFEPVVATRAK